MPKRNCPLLQGIGEITEAWNLTEKQFNMFVAIGFPARKVQGRWYAHSANVDEWFRRLLGPGKPIEFKGFLADRDQGI